MTNEAALSARYRFGDAARPGVLLGLPLRQSLPLIAGVLWLTLCLIARLPLAGLAGLMSGAMLAFGRWRRTPLYEVAAPAVGLVWSRWRGRRRWTRASLLGAGPGFERQVPAALTGVEVLEAELCWASEQTRVAVVRDRKAGSVSMAVHVVGHGFAVASPGEQDVLAARWGDALAPLARAGCSVSRVTWQDWTHPVGIAGHREFLATLAAPTDTAAACDYEELLAAQALVTVAHEVLVTLTVDVRRVRSRRGTTQLAAAIEALGEEMRLFTSRLEFAGLTVDGPLSPLELSTAIRLRSDPSRAGQLRSLRRSLAAAAGRGALEWGPMAVEPDWLYVRVDGSLHRSYRVASWPLLPVGADWMAPLLTTDAAVRTVTVVLEPLPLSKAAAEANRQLTSIESDHAQKERHGFRLTARERRRQTDVEERERELAEGFPEFRHAALVTVTTSHLDELDEACAGIEQAAAQSMLDLRPLTARQPEGWVASLPLGRSVRNGAWT